MPTMEISTCPSLAGGQPDTNSSLPAVRVALQLTGETEREQYGLAGHLIASLGPTGAHGAPRELVALVRIERSAGEPRLIPLNSATDLSPQDFERMKSALDRAWRTGTNVDVIDEQGHPLLQGALNAHPSGVARWLIRPSRLRMERDGVTDRRPAIVHSCW
jgi:hypothetical protein